MIGPADGWEHVEMRLRKERVSLEIDPVEYVVSMGTAYTKSVSANEANGFAVVLRDGPSSVGGPDGGGGTSLVTFADVQDAWEFAAITTYYLDERSPTELSNRIGDGRKGSQLTNGVVADESPLAVFEQLVGADTGPIESLRE
jgi:hypothetical protein